VLLDEAGLNQVLENLPAEALQLLWRGLSLPARLLSACLHRRSDLFLQFASRDALAVDCGNELSVLSGRGLGRGGLRSLGPLLRQGLGLGGPRSLLWRGMELADRLQGQDKTQCRSAKCRLHSVAHGEDLR